MLALGQSVKPAVSGLVQIIVLAIGQQQMVFVPGNEIVIVIAEFVNAEERSKRYFNP